MGVPTLDSIGQKQLALLYRHPSFL